MYSMNPYAQGGWHNPENPGSINSPSWSTPTMRQPSVLGALPVLGSVTPLEAGTLTVTFRLSPSYPDILNSFLYTPKGKPYLEIVTTTGAYSSSTYFRKGDGTLLAFIEWGQQTIVNIPGFVKQEPLSKWLPPTADQQRRMMFAKKRPFTWVPRERGINLFAVGSIIQEPMARVSQGNNCVILQLTSEAMQASLLESAIVATVLIYSGRRLD